MISDKKNPSAQNLSDNTKLILPGLLSFALLAILFSVPQPSIHVNQPFKAELLLSLVSIVLLVFARGKGQTNPLNERLAVMIGGFAVWSAVSAAWAASFGSVVHHTLLWVLYLVFFLIFSTSGFPTVRLRFVTTTFLMVALILGFLCVFDYITVVDFAITEGSIRIRYGKYAELLVTLSPILCAVAIYSRDRRRQLLMIAGAALSWLTVMLSLSKGAFIAGIVGFVFFFAGSALLSARRFRRRTLVCAGLWLALTIATQAFFSFFSSAPSTTNYITGDADKTRSTSAMRVFTWKVGLQMAADNLLTGVGADNFGVAVNNARAAFRREHPQDMTEEIAEDYLVERAHNEPLQVLAELGVIGFVLFLLPPLFFAFYLIKTFVARRRLSIILIAATAGMTAFLVSSQFSSFSFRSAQNGVVFFICLAVAVNQLVKKQTKSRSRAISRPVFAFAFAAASLMTVFCVTKVVAEYHAYMAERTPKNDSRAAGRFQQALTADPEYAGAYISYAARTAAEGTQSEAAQLIRKAIDNGIGTTVIYSQLAKRQLAAGDTTGAEATFREAIAIYPRSVYIRTEFILFLEGQGRTSDAGQQANIAQSIDLRQANGWYMIIKDGSVPAFYRARWDANLAPPAELIPSNAVPQYLESIVAPPK